MSTINSEETPKINEGLLNFYRAVINFDFKKNFKDFSDRIEVRIMNDVYPLKIEKDDESLLDAFSEMGTPSGADFMFNLVTTEVSIRISRTKNIYSVSINDSVLLSDVELKPSYMTFQKPSSEDYIKLDFS